MLYRDQRPMLWHLPQPLHPRILIRRVLRKTHRPGLDMMSFYDPLQTHFPQMARADDIHQGSEHHQGVIHTSALVRVEAADQPCGLAARNRHGDGETSIPEPAVMGTQVADVGQVTNEAFEYPLIQSVNPSQRGTVGRHHVGYPA